MSNLMTFPDFPGALSMTAATVATTTRHFAGYTIHALPIIQGTVLKHWQLQTHLLIMIRYSNAVDRILRLLSTWNKINPNN